MQRCTLVSSKSFYSWRTQQLAPGLLLGIRSSHTNAPAFTCAPSTLLTVKTQPGSKKKTERYMQAATVVWPHGGRVDNCVDGEIQIH
jgi:hypothetical protein